jgi:predicted regulator of Ras-like GTPase activity (Roadblock/LC7/MglB family)
MFGFLKNLLRKPAEEPDQFEDQDRDAFEDSPAAAQPAPMQWPANPRTRQRPAPTGFTPVQRQPVPAANLKPGISVSLQPILDNLPLELQPKLLYKDAGDSCIQVPVEKVLAQLSRGAIRISFGELRQLAPQFFAPETDRDKVMVALPLAEVLAKVNPAMLSRRRTQRTIEVPDDISSPFDPDSQGLVFSVGPPKPEAPEPSRAAPRAVPGSGPFVRNNAPAVPPQQAPTFEPAAPSMLAASRSLEGFMPGAQPPARPLPAAQPFQAPHARPISQPAQPRPAAPPSIKMPAAPAPVAYAPISMTPAAGIPVAKPISMVQPAAAPAPAAPAPVAALVPASEVPNGAAQQEPLWVPLTALADTWPDAVRAEIVHLNLVDAKVGLPVDVIEQSLKQGRVAFSWKVLRSYIRGGGLPVASAQDGVVLELPLRVVAPMFITRQSETAKQKQKIAIDAEIPNLFFGFPQPEGSNAAAKPVDTNYYVWDDTSDTARVAPDEIKRPASHSTGTAFISRCATPNEVVSRAAALDNVAGALVALPDGLMVASSISGEVNGDTLAAFLPQIFAKLTQCTRELRMGELNNLSFTVGNVPWKIFRVNAIFFAAFGKAGEALPTVQLAALAAELDRKAK